MLAFFIPLGISASLVTLSHVIINSTLARALVNPETVIAGYAIATSIFALTERPAVLLRQTCSALVRDRMAFKALAKLCFYILTGIFVLTLFISYTPMGDALFRFVFGADQSLRGSILDAYRILMFVTFFSAIRCIYHGIIISQMRTKWMTIGMVFRLAVMAVLAFIFISFPQYIDGRAGAIIFLAGMVTEALVSYIEGQSLYKKMPEKAQDEEKQQNIRSIFTFYYPLLISSFIAVTVAPAINAMLGKTTDIALAIASYALALGITQLVNSFFSYTHQIVLNFYPLDRTRVLKFTRTMSFIPGVALGLLAFTPLGKWVMENLIGASGPLLTSSLSVLKVFVIMSIVFPWIDFCNGLLMLRGQTRIMVWSQGSNVAMTVIVLLLCIVFTPGWNGIVGALAQSLGMAAELAVLGVFLYMMKRSARKS